MHRSADYYVTPYEDGCAIEREGEGTVSLHETEAEAVRAALVLAARDGADVLVRTRREGSSPPSRPLSTRARRPASEDR